MPHIYRTRTPTLARARRLRRDMTEAEKKLWRRIRDQQIGGHKFRKQMPIGPYVADFCCLAQHLIVEVDGGQHAEPSEAELRRNRFLAAEGYRIVRFWNNDVLGNIEGVLWKIAEALRVALDR
jgi:very-short-patch-repair endonuclease